MESRINQTVCVKCKHAFWAWDSGRVVCWQCEPEDPQVLAETLRLIAAGKGL